MSAEVFMRLTPRFSAGYMEIRKVPSCVFASFSLGWSASDLEEWRSETTLNPLFPCWGLGLKDLWLLKAKRDSRNSIPFSEKCVITFGLKP